MRAAPERSLDTLAPGVTGAGRDDVVAAGRAAGAEPTAVAAVAPGDGSRPHGRRRAAVVWTVMAVFVVAVGAVGSVLVSLGRADQHEALDPDSRAPRGAHAIAQILGDHGVTVDVVRRFDDVAAAAGAGATLVIGDDTLLGDDQLTQLAHAAASVVVLSPGSRTLDQLFDGSASAISYGTARVAASCDLAVASRAGDITPGVLYAPGGAATGCYPANGGFGLIAVGEEGSRRYVVDGEALLDNEHLADGGNAALAVALLGEHDRLVWYVPSADDPALATGQTLSDATPSWVSPAIVLLLVAAIVAMVWRGRRFGPLVAETLPVTVRAAETTAGRARLYARSGDALHAADQLRIDALGRIARLLGLGPAASTMDIADAAATRLGADRAAVRAVLLDDAPASSIDLVDLAERLRHLEAALRAAVHPGRTTS